jgi:mannose-1-phosphate guanylyltransferase
MRRKGILERLKAVLLIGGLGTRLRPLTNDRPKSTVPVLNRPVLEHTLAYLKQYGIHDVILTLNYLPGVIKQYFGDGEKFGVNLIYCLEDEPRGTAGAVKNAEQYLDGTFFVLNGDVFTNMNLTRMMAYHRQKKAIATIALTWVDNPSAFGVVETEKNGRVKQFIEKPPPGEATTNWINAGTYILEPEALNVIPAGQPYMFEKGLFPHLLKTGRPVYGYPYKGYWLDMGTPGHYHTINMDMMTQKITCRLNKPGRKKLLFDKKKVDIDDTAIIKCPAIIGDGCIIRREAELKAPVILGRDCRLGEGVVVENTVVWDTVTIGAGTKLKDCIVSSGTVIEENREIENCIITPAQIVPLPLAEPPKNYPSMIKE